jgi:hypothetical protein
MERSRERQKPVSARQQANELIGLIRKLRWMGLEEEAERVQGAVRRPACRQRTHRIARDGLIAEPL